MTMHFSPSSRGFYSAEIHGTSMPVDAVPITNALHQQLLADQTAGLEIAAGEGGQPMSRPRSLGPLAERQSRAWAAISRERDRRTQTGGFPVQGYWFHSDTFSRTQHLGMLMAGASLPPVQWKTMDGRFITMTPALAQQVFAAGAASDPLVFAAAEKHKAQMMSAPDPLAYDFSQGWPVTFAALFPNG